MRQLNLKEQSVLELIVQGMTAKEIAAYLHISESYAELLTQNILNKIGARNKTHVAALALRNNLIK